MVRLSSKLLVVLVLAFGGVIPDVVVEVAFWRGNNTVDLRGVLAKVSLVFIEYGTFVCSPSDPSSGRHLT